ncbi:prolyl oligopeptidase family serine peptidase [Dyadobacter sp. CY107]|uniref:alpha/beta hydrolase n=1 Tax=Dyadobacter fanqingshengii TaxID=2906443 RepID=UPI001F39F402|nr:alpha/beta hydrolase [Dyadobacter fanqingshengii]MCF2506864.1 prolyl oligopeptidase family serine peptidase [Dyadobacter fanqingshengii]
MKPLLTALLLIICLTNSMAQNYDEAKVPPYVLPELLKTTAGKEVKNKKMWEEVRRPEILRLFEDNIYGQLPKDYDSIRYTLKNEDKAAMNGRATLKEVAVQVYRNRKSVQINVAMFVPNDAKKPAPVFVLINNRGKENTDPTRKTKSGFWPAEMVIDSGYAVAAFHVSDLAPDNKDTFMNGVLQLYPDQLAADNGMRAIGAWAWGASRVMDYFENDKDIDPKNVIVVGHSRGGKASLWAAAQDQRFAVCVTNCSGNTGAALARRQFGERITRINTSFPHWFNNNYKKFNDNENELPVDQHMLIALIAPRPLYATNASKDLWADPTGTFLALKKAEDAYALYGITSKLPANPPAINAPITAAPLAYHNREGEHDLTAYDWGNFIRLAKIRR